MSYATPADIYRFLAAQAFVSRPRGLDARAGDALDFATGTFSLTGHGYSASDTVRLVLVGSGSVPSGATALLPYAVSPLDFWRFRLLSSGSVLTFADAGSGAWGLQVDPEVRLLGHLRDATGRINECLTAHGGSILVDPVTGLFPAVIVGVCARMAARSAVTSLQIENPAYRVPVDRLMAMAANDGDGEAGAAEGTILGDWKAGKPVYPKPTDATDFADNGARAMSRAPVGWLPTRIGCGRSVM